MSYFWILHVINSHGENFQQKVQKHPLLWSSQSWWFLTAQRGFTSVILEFWQELLEGLLTWRRGVAEGCDKKHNWPYLSVQHYHHNTPLPLGWSLIKLAMNFLSPLTQYCPHCLWKFGIQGGVLLSIYSDQTHAGSTIKPFTQEGEKGHIPVNLPVPQMVRPWYL